MNGPRQTAGNTRVVAARAFAGGHHAWGRARGLAVRHRVATHVPPPPLPRGDNDPISAVVSSGKDVRGSGRGCEEYARREEGSGGGGGGGGDGSTTAGGVGGRTRGEET